MTATLASIQDDIEYFCFTDPDGICMVGMLRGLWVEHVYLKPFADCVTIKRCALYLLDTITFALIGPTPGSACFV